MIGKKNFFNSCQLYFVTACTVYVATYNESCMYISFIRWPRRLTHHPLHATASRQRHPLLIYNSCVFVRMRICSTTWLVMAVESDERKALMEMSDALFEKSEQLKRLALLSGPIISLITRPLTLRQISV